MILSRMNAWVWATIVWLGLIFFSSTTLAGQSSEEAFSFLSSLFMGHWQRGSASYDIIHLLADKSVHVALFFVFAVLLWHALPRSPRKIVFILILGAVVGSCSELLQMAFPGRDPAIRDVLINTGATALGIAFSVAVDRLRAGRVQNGQTSGSVKREETSSERISTLDRTR